MSQDQPTPKTERELGMIEAGQAREDLYDTLGQLRVQLDYAQRIDDSVARAKHRIIAEKRENPLVFGAAVVGVVGTVRRRRMGRHGKACSIAAVATSLKNGHISVAFPLLWELCFALSGATG